MRVKRYLRKLIWKSRGWPYKWKYPVRQNHSKSHWQHFCSTYERGICDSALSLRVPDSFRCGIQAAADESNAECAPGPLRNICPANPMLFDWMPYTDSVISWKIDTHMLWKIKRKLMGDFKPRKFGLLYILIKGSLFCWFLTTHLG